MPKENNGNGWIKLHRVFLEWEWYQDSNTTRLFIHCLLSANHKDNKWRGILIKKGSFITSYNNLAEQLNLSKQQIRTALNKLILTHEITLETTHKFTLIKIEKWALYQDDNILSNTVNDTQPNTVITQSQHSNNTVITLNNKDNKEKKERIKEIKHKYGEYLHVLLTDKQVEKLKEKYYYYK